MSKEILLVPVSNEKYIVIERQDGDITVLCNGKPWDSFDREYYPNEILEFIIAMAQEIQSLRDEVESLSQTIQEMGS
jgi:hypothetical protein